MPSKHLNCDNLIDITNISMIMIFVGDNQCDQ